MRLKDRRKQWQKDCINWSWSLCGTIATPRTGKTLARKQKDFLDSGEYQTTFIWADDPEFSRRNMTAWDRFRAA